MRKPWNYLDDVKLPTRKWEAGNHKWQITKQFIKLSLIPNFETTYAR